MSTDTMRESLESALETVEKMRFELERVHHQIYTATLDLDDIEAEQPFRLSFDTFTEVHDGLWEDLHYTKEHTYRVSVSRDPDGKWFGYVDEREPGGGWVAVCGTTRYVQLTNVMQQLETAIRALD